MEIKKKILKFNTSSIQNQLNVQGKYCYLPQLHKNVNVVLQIIYCKKGHRLDKTQREVRLKLAKF